MEILLKKDVANLGYAGEIVKVKAGYAMNYLVPQGFATVATESVKKQHAETLRQRAHKEAKLVADAEALAATINAQVVEVKVKVSESGKLYGSVTTMDLAEALNAKGLNIDKKDITILAGEVKEVGEYEASVKLYKAIKGTFNFGLRRSMERYAMLFRRRALERREAPMAPASLPSLDALMTVSLFTRLSEYLFTALRSGGIR